MDQAVAYSTLAMTVSLAITRPGFRSVRFTPGSAAVLGVALLLVTGVLSPHDLGNALSVQWRPLVSLASIMVMTGVVTEVGAFDRLAAWLEARARGRTAVQAFTLLFVMSVIVPAVLNNDAAILTLTPISVALSRRLFPGQPRVTIAFAFAVFLAPGVAPFVVSNPMNMIVAEYAHVGFNAYAAVMVPLSIAGAVITYGILRLVFRDALRTPAAPVPVVRVHAHRAEKPAVAIMVAVFFAYPIAAALGLQIFAVAAAGAAASLLVARIYRVAPAQRLARHVSLDILAFLWGIFAIVHALQQVGLADALASVYHAAPVGRLATIGTVSAFGSALVDNHPLALLNMMALHDTRDLLAALVGGDIGPRLLPIGSLAGLLWMDLLRRQGVSIGIGRFVRIGTLVLIPTLAVSLLLLGVLT